MLKWRSFFSGNNEAGHSLDFGLRRCPCQALASCSQLLDIAQKSALVLANSCTGRYQLFINESNVPIIEGAMLDDRQRERWREQQAHEVHQQIGAMPQPHVFRPEVPELSS